MAPDVIDSAEIDRHLDRVLASEPFASSAQISAFLRYVIGETLAGRSSAIKSYTIAVDALGRPASFDPQRDPSVRVVAGRVRRALALYYAGEGSTEPIRIVLRPGSYVPSFERAPPQEVAEPAPSGDRTRLAGLRRVPPALLLGAVAALAVLGLVTWAALVSRDPGRPDAGAALPSLGVTLSFPPRLPGWLSRAGFVAATDVVLSRFDEVRLAYVLGDSLADEADQAPADYGISLTLEPSGEAVHIFAQVVRGRDEAAIWSRRMTADPPEEPSRIDVMELIGREVGPIASPYGVILSDLAGDPDADEDARCIAGGYAHFWARSLAEHAAALPCARDLADAGSRLPTVWALLTFLELDAYRSGETGDAERLLATAHRYALRAVELAPASARAHQALFAFYKVSGDHANARLSAEKAVALNPFDLDIAGDYGSYLVSRGAFEAAMPLMREVERLALRTPEWFDFHLFLGARFTGDRQAQMRAIGRLRGHSSALANIALAIAAHDAGELGPARRALDALVAAEPGFATNPKERLIRRGFDEATAAAVAAELFRAGLRISL